MIKRIVITSVVSLGLCTIANSVAQVPDKVVQEFRAAIPPETMTNAEVFETNGFRLESSQVNELGANLRPDGNQMQLLSVSASGVFRAVVEKGRPISRGGGVALFHRDTGQAMLSAADADGDGRLDGLTYSKLGEGGEVVVTVTDYEADGQPDLRLNFRDGYNEIWHADRWYRIENRDDRRGIVMNGEFVELRNENNRLIVP